MVLLLSFERPSEEGKSRKVVGKILAMVLGQEEREESKLFTLGNPSHDVMTFFRNLRAQRPS